MIKSLNLFSFVYSNITYLKMSGAAIYKGMVSADPDAVWYVSINYLFVCELCYLFIFLNYYYHLIIIIISP